MKEFVGVTIAMLDENKDYFALFFFVLVILAAGFMLISMIQGG